MKQRAVEKFKHTLTEKFLRVYVSLNGKPTHTDRYTLEGRTPTPPVSKTKGAQR